MTHTKTPTTTWHGLAIEYEYGERYGSGIEELIDWWLASNPVDDAELLAEFLYDHTWRDAAAQVATDGTLPQGALDWLVTTFAREIDAACEDDYDRRFPPSGKGDC